MERKAFGLPVGGQRGYPILGQKVHSSGEEWAP